MVDAELDLEITETENRFLELIKEFQNNSPSCPTKAPLRLVGGWVRDRLMGIKSHDIDIALEDCTGQTFVKAFEEWLHGSSVEDISLCRSMVVKANAAKSKHLETAILDMPALGLSIDFVNLRSEIYDNNSRIPTKIAFGTPAEDCLRRDLTINSIFFNLQSMMIEDWSGKGIDDLRTGILRTPRDPERTFLDDPLRILRILRFTAKLDRTEDSAAFCHSPIGPQAPKLFQLEPSIGEAVEKPHIRNALINKVTKERLRAELCLMFEYPNIAQGLWLLHKWQLFSCLFTPLSHDYGSEYDCAQLTAEWPKIGLLVEHVMNYIGRDKCGKYLSLTDPLYTGKYATFERRGVMILASMLANQHKFKVKCKGGGAFSAAQDCLLALKSKVMGTHIGALLDIVDEFLLLKKVDDRERMIRVLRMKSAAKWWEYALILAKCIEHFGEVSAKISSPSYFAEKSFQEEDNITDEILSAVAIWRQRILVDQKLAELWDYKPVLSGQDVTAILKDLNKVYKPQHVGAMMIKQAEFVEQNWHPDPNERAKLAEQLTSVLREYALTLE